MKHKFLGFSLIELLISLIVISLIAAAFAPVISKKLKSGGLSIGVGFGGSGGGSGGGGGGDIGSISLNCDKFGESCLFCSNSECYLCNHDCNGDQFLNISNCSCESCADVDPNAVSCKYDKVRRKGVATRCKDDYYIQQVEGPSYGTCLPCNEGMICNGVTQALCDDGTYMLDGYCVECGAGHYCTNAVQTPCPVGTYQDHTGQSGCNPCPSLTYTAQEGSLGCIGCTDACEYCEPDTGVCQTCLPGFYMEEGNTCYPEMEFLATPRGYWTLKEPGQQGGPSIPNAVTVCDVGQPCSGGGTSPTCWQGATSGSGCNDTTGASGCNRMVCNWYAANLICKNLHMELPTKTQLEYLGTNPDIVYTYAWDYQMWQYDSVAGHTVYYASQIKTMLNYTTTGANLCSAAGSNVSYSRCPDLASGCMGAINNNCSPSTIWGSTIDADNAYWEMFGTMNLTYSNSGRSGTNKTGLHIYQNYNTAGGYTNERSPQATSSYAIAVSKASKQNANSVRCYSPNYLGKDCDDPNCYTCDNAICLNCKQGYKLVGNGCVRCSTSEYCPNGTGTTPSQATACASTQGLEYCTECSDSTCTACSSGATLANGICIPNSIETVQSGNYFWTTKNPGEAGGPPSLQGSGSFNTVVYCTAGQFCRGGTDTPTCWQGTTGGSGCDAAGGSNGCSNTLCNWYAANLICENIHMHLPTKEQFESLGTNPEATYIYAWDYQMWQYDKYAGHTVYYYSQMKTMLNYTTTGTNLCRRDGSNVSYSKCPDLESQCVGAANSGRCTPNTVWGANIDANNAYWEMFGTMNLTYSNSGRSGTNKTGLHIYQNSNTAGGYTNERSPQASSSYSIAVSRPDKQNAQLVRCVR